MYIFSGVIAMLVAIVLEILWHVFFGVSLLDICIVLGSFLVGIVVSGIMTKAMVKFNKKGTQVRMSICILMAIGTFIAINYTEYKIYEEKPKYVKWHYNISDEGEYSFISYIKCKLDNKELRIHGKRRTTIINTKGTPNYVIFFIQFITVILGGLWGYKFFRKKYYCDECKKYYVYKPIFSVKAKELNTISRKGHIDVSNIKKIEEFVQAHKLTKIRKKLYYVGILAYCDECKKGKLIVKKIMPKEKDERELYDFRQVIDVDAQFVKVISSVNVETISPVNVDI